MARSGPTIPIYIDIDTSARQAIQKWDKYNKEFAKISARYEREARGVGMNNSEFKQLMKNVAATSQRADELRNALKRNSRTIDGLKEKALALTMVLNRTNPNTKKWEKYNEKLRETKKSIAAIEARMESVSARKAAIDAVSESFKQQSSYVGRLVERLALYWGIHQAVSMLRNIREVTAEFELQRVALGALLQSTSEASILFERIKKAAVKSPFEVKDLVTYTKQLSAYQIEQDELYDTMMRLGDLSAGLGVDMNRLILAYGQVKAASVLRGQEMRQFTEAGIPLVQALADKFSELRGETVSTAEVFDLVSKKAVSFEMVKEVIQDMTDVGGQFYQMQEKQAETLAGRWSNLKDTISIAYDEIGNTEDVSKGLNLLISTFSYIASNWRGVVKTISNLALALTAVKIASVNARMATKALTIAEAQAAVAEANRSVKLGQLLTKIIGTTRATKIETFSTNLLRTAQVRLGTSTNVVTAAFWKLTAAMASNPIGAIILAGTALIGVLSGIAGHFKKVEEDAKSANDYAVQLQETVDKFLNTEKESVRLTDTYESLTNKTNKSIAESSKLRTVAALMVDRYGASIIKSVEKETGAMEIDIEKVKELMAAENARNEQSVGDEIVKQEERLATARQELIDETARLREMEANPVHYEPVVTGSAVAYSKSGYDEKQVSAQAERVKEIQNNVDVLIRSLSDARNALAKTQQAAADVLTSWKKVVSTYTTELRGGVYKAFTKDEIEGFESEKAMLDEAYKRYKSYAEQRQSLDLLIAVTRDAALKKSYEDEANTLKAMEELYSKVITDFNGWSLVRKTSKGQGRTAADMFSELTKEQAGFFKDFKKNVDDLGRYVSQSEAAKQVSELMRGRANELGIDILGLDASESTYSAKLKSLIESVQEKIQKFSAAKGKNTLAELMGLKTNNAELKKYLDLLKTLWSQYTDQMLQETQTKMSQSFKTFEQYIKKVRTAREFYDKMFEITSDTQLSSQIAQAVYGDTGEGLRAALNEQLRRAFSGINLRNLKEGEGGALKDYIDSLSAQGVDISTSLDAVGDSVQRNAEKIRKYTDILISQKDWSTLSMFLEALPAEAKTVANQIISDQQKTNADWIANLMKTYAKTKDFEQRRTDIVRKAEADRKALREKASESGLGKSDIDNQLTAITNAEQQQLAALDLEILKSSSDWEKSFGDMERIGRLTISSLIEQIDKLISKYKEAGADGENALTVEALKNLEQSRTKLVEESEKRSPYIAIQSGLKGYFSGVKDIIKFRKQLKAVGDDAEATAKILQSLKDAENGLRDSLKKLGNGITQMSSNYENVSSVASQFNEVLSQIGVDETNDIIAGVKGIASAFGVMAAALTLVNGLMAVLDTLAATLMANPLIAAASAILAAVVGIVGAITSIKTNRANKEIEKQAKAIDALEESYERLSEAIEKAFGEDYISNYNMEIANLQARAEAYRKQAAAESSKGKSKDKDKIEEYLQSARDLELEIEEMEGQLAEHFSGTDLSSSAKEFADAWIEAYKEFSSTTDAMSEQFQEMVQSMVTESLAARAMQNLLKPIFDAIDEAAASGGDLTAEEIASISQMASDTIPEINAAMVNLMNQLGAAGLNVREQASGLTGISKDIASASEESILGLAAGINTQNFYIAQTNEYVHQILQILSGGGSAVTTKSATMASVGDDYLASLPTIADHTASILQRCESLVRYCESISTNLNRVIQPKGTTGSYWVTTS